MENQKINMEQFQMPDIYRYKLYVSNPYNLYSAYSAREYSQEELGKVLYNLQAKISQTKNRNENEISDLVERELQKAGFATELPEPTIMECHFPTEMSCDESGKVNLSSRAEYREGENSSPIYLGQYDIEFDESGKITKKNFVLHKYAKDKLARIGKTLKDIGINSS